jgi:hypothetical protein
VIAAPDRTVVAHVVLEREEEMRAGCTCRSHRACARLGVVEDLEVLQLRTVPRPAVAMPVLGRQGTANAVIPHQDRQPEGGAEERANRACRLGIQDDVLVEPGFLEDGHRLRPRVLVELTLLAPEGRGFSGYACVHYRYVGARRRCPRLPSVGRPPTKEECTER